MLFRVFQLLYDWVLKYVSVCVVRWAQCWLVWQQHEEHIAPSHIWGEGAVQYPDGVQPGGGHCPSVMLALLSWIMDYLTNCPQYVKTKDQLKETVDQQTETSSSF